MTTVASFVDQLCQSRVLDARQTEKLTRDLQYRFADPYDLAQDLVRRGWLTPDQVNPLLTGKPVGSARFSRGWWKFNIIGGIVIVVGLAGIILYVRHDRLGARDRAEAARLAALDQQAQAELKPLLDAFDSSTIDDTTLRKQLLALRTRYAEVPAAQRAAELLSQLPSPLDKRERAAIPAEEREPNQPENLVAVLGQRRWRHWGPVRVVASTASGATVASAGDDNVVRVWDRGKQEELAVLQLGKVAAMTFVGGDKMLAVHTADGNVVLWEIDKRTKYGDYPGPAKNVVTAAFRGDGLVAASVADDGTVKVWELQTGKELGTLRGHDGKVHAVAFSPDGSIVATAGADRSIKLWRPSGVVLVGLSAHVDSVHSLAFSPDGQFLASGGGSNDRRIIIWDLSSGQPVFTLEGGDGQGHDAAVLALAYSSGGRYIVSGSSDQSLRIWELPEAKEEPKKAADEKPKDNPEKKDEAGQDQPKQDDPAMKKDEPPLRAISTKLVGHTGAVNALVLAGAGSQRIIVSAGDDGVVRLWNMATRSELNASNAHQGPVSAVVFLDDGKLLATGSYDRTIKIWDAEAGHLRKTLTGHRAAVTALSYALNQRQLASASYDATVKIWDPINGLEFASLGPNMGPVLTTAFSLDGKSLAVGATSSEFQGGELKVWEPPTHKQRHNLGGHRDLVASVAFTADGRSLASGGNDGLVRLWEPWTGIPRAILSDEAAIEAVAFSADGKQVAAGTHARAVKIWDAASERLLQSYADLSAVPQVLTYSPNGRVLAALLRDGKVVIWHTATGERREWPLPGPANGLAFAPDSRHLATANANGTVYILRLAEPAQRRPRR
jgi:WD40 repeat protein